MAAEKDAVSVRPARSGDLERLQAIQLAAGGAFREIGMTAVADSPPLAIETLSGYGQAGRAWVAVNEHDEPVAFVVVDVVDGCAHVDQVSVHPAHSGREIGGMLLDHVAAWAATRALDALTLITFRGVPWNAPYYERLGFAELADTEITPGLAARQAGQARRDFARAARVCMRRPLAEARRPPEGGRPRR